MQQKRELMETPVNAPFKEKCRIEIAKLRQMSFKQKAEYIWEYYKIHIIGIGIFVILISLLLNAWVCNPRPNTVLFIAWSAGYITDEQISTLTDAVNERLIDDDKNETAEISLLLTNNADPASMMAYTTRLIAMLTMGEIDIFILNSGLFEDYRSVYLRPMEDVLDQIKSIDVETYDRINDRVVYTISGSDDEQNGEDRAMGIDITDCPLFLEIGIINQELFFCIPVNSKNLDNVVSTLILFFQWS